MQLFMQENRQHRRLRIVRQALKQFGEIRHPKSRLEARLELPPALACTHASSLPPAPAPRLVSNPASSRWRRAIVAEPRPPRCQVFAKLSTQLHPKCENSFPYFLLDLVTFRAISRPSPITPNKI